MNQLSVMDYMGIKKEIKTQLNNIQSGFVNIGYQLKQIRDTAGYTQDGYKDIWEFAQKEFNLSRSTASRFMAVNDRFSIGGNSPEINPAYKGLGASKLQEMLTLSDDDCKMISDEHTVQDIRTIKEFAKEEQETAPTPMEQLLNPKKGIVAADEMIAAAIRQMYANEKMERLFNGQVRGSETAEEVAEYIRAIVPTVFKHERIMLFIGDYDAGIRIKIMGESEKKHMSWPQFCVVFGKVFAAAGEHLSDPWRATYPELTKQAEKEENKKEKNQPKHNHTKQHEAVGHTEKKEEKKSGLIKKPAAEEEKEHNKTIIDMPLPEPVTEDITTKTETSADLSQLKTVKSNKYVRHVDYYEKIANIASGIVTAARNKEDDAIKDLLQELSAEVMLGGKYE